ncbi:GTP-binding protein TrmE N-terminus-domain-containing protein [Xylariaceae sp. FL0804]|nr:GTP-binding protein TrmE N-terminus-domain-containing protein [Xylariaceae sp. FL0804]
MLRPIASLSAGDRIGGFVRQDDTIYALSSAAGRAGIAVIRISGPACKQVYAKLCPHKDPLRPRYAAVRTLYDPRSESSPEILDAAAMVLYFPAPKTVTGDDVLELHVHGGSATVKAVLAAIPRCSSPADGQQIRYAEPGEFTKRAFLNDRLDLAQVEALGETLAAETEQQRRAAVRGSSGALGRAYEDWRGKLLHARAELEALIDFQEDQHLDESPAALVGAVTDQVRAIMRSIDLHEAAGRRSELLRSGIEVALVGPPNAGKSSLMNQIVGREASIVSGESGTTRDIVEANLDIRGFLCTFADTAGFRSTTGGGGGSGAEHGPHQQSSMGAVEEEGIRRARIRAEQADVVIAVASVETPDVPPTNTTTTTTTTTGEGGGGARPPEIRYDAETLRLAARSGQALVVVNKRDAVPAAELRRLVAAFRADVLARTAGLEDADPILVSCKEAREGGPQGQSHSHSHSRGRGRSRSSQKQTKSDEEGEEEEEEDEGGHEHDPGSVGRVAEALAERFRGMTELPAALADLHGVTERQRQLLAQCRRHLEDYVVECRGAGGEEEEEGEEGKGEGERRDDDVDDDEEADVTVAAEHLRCAARCLGRITGRGEAGDVEEVLGVIFEK